MSTAGKVEIANKALAKRIITTPEEYIEFINRDLDSKESLEILFLLYLEGEE